MTNEEVKKIINYQYQLSTFAIDMSDTMKDHVEWTAFANRLRVVAKDMIAEIEKKL